MRTYQRAAPAGEYLVRRRAALAAVTLTVGLRVSVPKPMRPPLTTLPVKSTAVA
jgi:hypothetical protein